MKTFGFFAGKVLAVSFAVSALTGCPGGAVAELTEEKVAEAIANQALSSYYEFEIGVTTGSGAEVVLACEKGGELNWEQVDEDGTVFKANSRGCTVSGAYGSVTLEGEYTVTVTDEDENADLTGKSFQIDGTVTATTGEGASKDCSYSLTLDVVDAEESGGSVTVNSAISGQICNSKNFSLETEFTITGQVEVESEGE